MMSQPKIESISDEEAANKPSSLCLVGECTVQDGSPVDTPGDSGVLCLDSESDLTSSTAFMTTSLAGTEELACDSSAYMTRSDIDNRNISEDIISELSTGITSTCDNLPDVVLKALESENSRGKIKVNDLERCRIGEPKKSLSEDIVFRRKCKKKSGTTGAQKKRVSFHEDILNSTKADNIHIERGFISYNPGGSYCGQFRNKECVNERFSWCASGDNLMNKPPDVGQQALSDIVTYKDRDKSGIFEYVDLPKRKPKLGENLRKDSIDEEEVPSKRHLYGCESNSSDSNLSCQSESSSNESTSSHSNETCTQTRKCEKAQKSFSCDCFNNNSRHTFMRKMYFSEADIDQEVEDSQRHMHINHPISQSPGTVKSVLKKKRYIPTNIVEEHKKENKKGIHILPNKSIFKSLKSFYKTFNFTFTPEKGLPEGMEDSRSVVEAIPCENKIKYLSKSLDSGFQVDEDDDFVQIHLNEQPSHNEITLNFSDNVKAEPVENPKVESASINEDSPRKRLTLEMNLKHGNKVFNPTNSNDLFPDNSKYIVNGESIVYEHKGVSFCYMHDSFKTAFEVPKEMFVPIMDKIENKSTKILAQSNSKNKEFTAQNISDKSENVTSPTRNLSETLDKQSVSNINQYKYLQSGIPKHLASPKKQNVSRFYSKASTSGRKEDINCNITETCSLEDNSTLKGIEDTFEELEIQQDPVLQKDFGNKALLLNRYLKNVCQKRDLDSKIRNNEFFRNKLKLEKKSSLVFPMKNVSPNFKQSAARLSRLIDKEVMENKRVSVRLLTANEPSYFDSFEDDIAIECSEKLKLQIFTQPSETLHRMLKVRSPYKCEDGSWRPLLAIITNYALYVAEVYLGRTEYNVMCRLPHCKLDAIVLGPSCAYVRVLGVDGRVACSLVTGEPALSLRLITSLEWAARTSPQPPRSVPAAITLGALPLARDVARQRLSPNGGLWFYGQVCSGDVASAGDDAAAACPPQCDGYLMYKTDAKKRWQPGYFLLKNGVLSWGPHSPDGRGPPLPQRLPLSAVAGVRRVAEAAQRPHCFEMALARGGRVLLAAPDDPTASAWLQAMLMHAAQSHHNNNSVGKKLAVKPLSQGLPPALTVLVTPTEVISLREALDLVFVNGAAAYMHHIGAQDVLREYTEQMKREAKILSCGSLKNLTSFKIPNNDDNWCVLEWSVCEAQEHEEGLSLVFASGAELERFISATEKAFCALTGLPFPLSVMESEESSASVAHARYEQAWAHMLPSH